MGPLIILSLLVLSLGLEVDSKTPEQLVSDWLRLERLFIADMNNCIEYFKKPMMGDGTGLKFVGYATVHAQLDQVFGPVEKFIASQEFSNPLYNFVSNSVEGRSSPVTPDEVIKAFTDLSDGSGVLNETFVELYSDYMIAHQMMGPLSVQPAWNNYDTQLRRTRRIQADATALDALLVKPVQRLMHYSLFLAELKSLTMDSSDKKKIDEALRVVKEASSECNERVREAEAEQEKAKLRNFFEEDVLREFGKWIGSFELIAKEEGDNFITNNLFGKKPLPCILHIFANYVVLLVKDTEKGITSASRFPVYQVRFSYAAAKEKLRLEYAGRDAGKKFKPVFTLTPKDRRDWAVVLQAIKNALANMGANAMEMVPTV